MSLLIVGSIALDTVETQTEKRDRVLGGSATYFSYAASFFAPVRLVGVVGSDWPEEYSKMLEGRNVDLKGLEIQEGPTFAWHGKYQEDMNIRDTLDVQLGVFAEFDPKVPQEYKDTKYVFLGNCSPVLQMKTLDAIDNPVFSLCDTMDLWINTEKDALMELLGKVDGLIINDSEVRQLTGEKNLIAAAEKALSYGPKFLFVKKGEHGAFIMSESDLFMLPAFPLKNVADPTGAGDSFAGGLMGYLAKVDDCSFPALKKAAAYGTILASFCCEDFSLEKYKQINNDDIENRMNEFKKYINLD